MLWGAHIGGLELRQAAGGEIRLSGRFPYGAEAELAPGRAELIAPRAFAESLAGGGDVHFLAGHDFNRPLASRAAGSLELIDTPEALEIHATIAPELARVGYVQDLLSAHAARLVRGLSPGFRVRQGGERIERRGDGLLRTITGADLVELSAVTRPAYGTAQIEARAWQVSAPAPAPINARIRWRA